MEISKQDFDIIQKYIKDNLSAEDKIYFDSRVKDSVFRNELWSQVKILEAVEEIETEKLREYFKSIDDTQSPSFEKHKEPKRRTLNIPSLLKYAAVLTGLLISAYFIKISLLSEDNNKELFAEYYQTYPAQIIERGDTDVVNSNFNKAMELYRDQNFKQSLSTLLSISESNESVSIYKASCHMELNEYDKAELIFKELLLSQNRQNVQVAEWNIALINVYKNSIETAKLTLNKIAKDDTHLYYSKAVQLIKVL